jgi:hypothetical protein
MLRLRRTTGTTKTTHRRLWWTLGCVLTFVTVSACELIAGIDEKVAANAGPVGPEGGTDTGPAVVGDGSTGQPDSTAAECSKHADCISKHGENWVCVKPDNKCRSLLNDDCEVVLAAGRGAPPAQKQEVLADDNTIFFGFIMDLRGSGKNAGIARRQAVELAIGDIHTVTKGIPGGAGGRRRPIAVVTCSETKDATSAADPKVPARHLIDELHVPAIIGASNSDTTIDLFNGEGLPKSTLVFSPNALSSALSSPSDNGLFWRTSATSVLQGKAIQQQVGFVEQQILDTPIDQGGAAPPLKIAFAYIGDAFGKDIFPHIRDGLIFNGVPLETGVNGATCNAMPCAGKVLVKEYSPTAQLDVLTALGNEIKSFAPHIFVAIGRKDAVQVSAAIESQNPTFLPTHLFTQGSATVDVTTLLTPNPDPNGIRARVRGTRPLASPDEAAVFLPLYTSAFPSGPASGNGVPGCFDITYLLTYGALGAPGDSTAPLTGPRMNEGLKRALDRNAAPTNVVKVGTADLPRGMDALVAGHNVNVKGVSYIFDFDTSVGEAPGKVDIWCISQQSNLFKGSGMIFDPARGDGGTTTKADGGLPPLFNCPAN